MKKSQLFKSIGLMMTFATMMFLTSCFSEDDIQDLLDPVASFQIEVSTDNFLEVSFTNFSLNADSYAWTFGDGGTSTETDPTYTYMEAGTFTVTLVASNTNGATSTFTDEVTITDPLAAQRALIGENGKVWQLVADNSTGVNPLQVGPTDRSAVWFAIGDLCSRECIFDDTWTFNTDGTFTYENNGDYWYEGGLFANGSESCFEAIDANYVGPGGEDLTDWNSGTHPFTYDPTSTSLTINGGFIGLTKAGTDKDSYTTPQPSVTYNVAKLVEVEGAADTLVLETDLTDDDGVVFGYWAFTLVSYANASDAVIVEECPTSEKTLIDVVNIDFESTSNWNPFGGNDDAGGGMVMSVIANPDASGINTSANVGSLEEPDGSRFYSGASTQLDGYIDFSVKKTIKFKVWSPIAGATVKFKLEDSADASVATETDFTITAADTWEEFEVLYTSNDQALYDVIAVFFDFDPNADQSNKSGARTHYFDDIILVE
ncbi:PKD domain-containing protein [Ekhidna sp.]|uniref:PKD domain-containing protein n=1 Tax=Ekhidna sp. TaxID=2608089 RepID=UPI00329A1E8F